MCFCFQTRDETFQKKPTIGKQMSNESFRPVGLGDKEASSFPFYHFNTAEQRNKSSAADSAVISLQLSESIHFPGFLAVH